MNALGDRPTIVCNGMIGREAFTARDREQNFYMIGSMGLGLSIALGVAVTHPEKPVVCLDGDGNVLMRSARFRTTSVTSQREARNCELPLIAANPMIRGRRSSTNSLSSTPNWSMSSTVTDLADTAAYWPQPRSLRPW